VKKCEYLAKLLVSCHSRSEQRKLLADYFKADYESVVPQPRLIYGDYLVPGAEPKVSSIKLSKGSSPVWVMYYWYYDAEGVALWHDSFKDITAGP
jgi:hypothetical protein